MKIDFNPQTYTDSELHVGLQQYGEGWVADEALAIALYCLMQSENPLEQIIIAANHNGDSDSTACICG
jgi:ADP-ribosylglycohydrolase